MDNKAFEKYTHALNNASLLAQQELISTLEKLDYTRPRTVRNATIEIVTAIVDKYSNMAALAAAEYYETERKDSIGGNYSAFLAEPVTIEQIESTVRYAVKFLFEGDENDGTAVYGLFDGSDRPLRKASGS